MRVCVAEFLSHSSHSYSVPRINHIKHVRTHAPHFEISKNYVLSVVKKTTIAVKSQHKQNSTLVRLRMYEYYMSCTETPRERPQKIN